MTARQHDIWQRLVRLHTAATGAAGAGTIGSGGGTTGGGGGGGGRIPVDGGA